VTWSACSASVAWATWECNSPPAWDFEPFAIARGKDKEPLARKLGAQHYIDSATQDPGVELGKLGGARVIISTVTNAAAMSAVLPGLGVNGQLILLGVSQEPVQVPSMLMVGGRRSIAGWPSGTLAGFRGRDGLQRAGGGSVNDRNHAAGARCRSL
jgi:D-arabinose 1-dehydrogenase-like Zn-dependent alcohol dehydrogenase